MCGIAGFFDGKGQKDFDRGLLKRMADAIAHRGPDGEGFYVVPGLALAHRRLAIIDLASGQQPMLSVDGKVVITFNGELYNYRELALELQVLGYTFQTQSDTEVILNAWREWGANCVRRFRGMFAFALWDMRAETFFLVRDHLGKKPLYYSIADQRLLSFASEIKGLLPCSWISRALSPTAVDDYFCLGYVPDPKSIYRDVLKLPPGHILAWKRGQTPTVSAYWEIDLSQGSVLNLQDAAEELASRLKSAVEQRMVADVPLGAFLSGGVDSSGVVAHMARASAQPVKTCTIGFGENSHDERVYARALAQRYETDHVEKVLDQDSISRNPDLLDRIAAAYDEPFADSSAIPTYQVCAAARETVTVALSGDGGDEAFGGYRRYSWHMHEHMVRACMPDWLRRPAFGLLARVYPKMAWAPQVLRARTTFHELSQNAAGAYLNNVSVMSDNMRAALYSSRFKSDLQGYHSSNLIEGLMARAPADNPLLQAQYIDMKTWLAGRMLVKVDRASMAHGLEVRSPFLDHELFQWALSLPARLKVAGGERKIVLKHSLEPFVPTELLHRPKQGFGVPMAEWLRGGLQRVLRKALVSPLMKDAGYFQQPTLGRLVDEHMNRKQDHSAALWSLLMFERFLSRQAQI